MSVYILNIGIYRVCIYIYIWCVCIYIYTWAKQWIIMYQYIPIPIPICFSTIFLRRTRGFTFFFVRLDWLLNICPFAVYRYHLMCSITNYQTLQISLGDWRVFGLNKTFLTFKCGAVSGKVDLKSIPGYSDPDFGP